VKPIREVGISGYGAYIPRHVISNEEIARVWSTKIARIGSKRFPNVDEDTVTIAYEAAKLAIESSKVNYKKIGAVFVGTESKPYAVKPTGTILAEALGITPNILAADLEFACKAGTEAIQISKALVASGMIEFALAIGVDVAQGRPGDELEYTAGAGGAAFIIAPKSEETIAFFEASFSYVTDTPDFWRRQGAKYPRHLFRFTGEPAYFHHIISAVKKLFDLTGLSPNDFDFAVFHQPNVKFPIKVAKALGFNINKIKQGLLCFQTGNFYAGSSLVGLASVLDVAKPGQRILLASFGSGAGSDAFSIVVQDAIEEKRCSVSVDKLINRRKFADYAKYARFRGKLLK